MEEEDKYISTLLKFYRRAKTFMSHSLLISSISTQKAIFSVILIVSRAGRI